MLKTLPQLRILSNGVRVVTFPLPGTETVTVLILVKIGSRHEQARLQGVSHFLEHLFFKGTAKRPSVKDISHLLDSIGAQFNAFTTKEFTGFYITAAFDKIDLLLDVLSDVLLNSLFEPQEIERERGVILEEMKLYYDTPARHITSVFEELLWRDHPLGRDIIGTSKTLTDLDYQDIVTYFKTHYIASHTVISVAGKFDETSLLKKLETFFKKFSHGIKDQSLYPPKNPGVRMLIREKKTDQAHLALGVESFGLFDKRRETAELLATILGGGMSSRLFIRVREELGLAYYIYTSSEHYQDTGHLSSFAGVNLSKVDLALQAIVKEYRKIAKEPLGQEELTKAKEFIKGQLLLELESSFAMARLIAFKELFLEMRERLEEYFGRLDAITSQDIKEVAAELFKKTNLRLAIIGPFSKRVKFAKLL